MTWEFIIIMIYLFIYLFDDSETFIKIILYNNIEVKLNVRR